MASNGVRFNASNRNLIVMVNETPSFEADSTPLTSLDGVMKSVSKRPFYNTLDAEEAGDEDLLDECVHQPGKKRRLSADQVHFLEKSFEVDNKLEPERKTQLARDLGLQPRQVAVWFQNRRARWKTKQLEREYDILKSSYDTLRVDYDNLLKEKEKLRSEVICLTDKLHAKEKGLEIQTNDLETTCKKTFIQSNSQFESLEKSGIVSKGMTAPFDQQLVSYSIEDPLSSGTDGSAVVDEESPHHIDSGHSSVVGYVTSTHISPFEADLSDFSHVDEEEEEGGISEKLLLPQDCHMKMECILFPEAPTTSCTYVFAMDDQENLSWWDWP
uniref:Homeobox domain-containing protein n=3 Tax=Picea sitchensis TaxID=3332 RepID=B8LKP4_PICSI|nr:unknown [Picea sitchensis]